MSHDLNQTSENSERPNGARSLKASQTAATRTRIVQAALGLFNEHGTRSISTHDIATAANLSPGNLYYHFKNKEEIIRQIFYQMDIYSTEKWEDRGPANPRTGITDFLRFFLGNLWNYRFFFREFSNLLHKDPVLAKMWRDTYDLLFSAMKTAVHRWVKAGILKPFASPAEVEAFIENCWIILNFSSVFLEAKGNNFSTASHTKSLHHLLRFLYPYHTPKGQQALDLHF